MSFPDDLPIGEPCANCGMPDFDCECGGDAEILIECDACDGDGWVSADGIKVECAECMGEGWV